MERRQALGGSLPKRVVNHEPLPRPVEDLVTPYLEGSGDMKVSTTSVGVRIMRDLVRDPNLGERVVPIVPDEGRTFGMESMFTEVGIYHPDGMNYVPVDADMMISYREAANGQVLEEGITEAGALASFQAAATSYATNRYPMISKRTFHT